METKIKVRGYHTDLYQHVNNARYLEFLEEGRWQLLEDHLKIDDFIHKGWFFYVVNINISYKSQARVNDTVVVRSGLDRIGNKSAVIRQQVINETTGALCVDADVTFVIAGLDQKPLVFEGELKEVIERLPEIENRQEQNGI
ncbi:MAG: acyl-CoA thioesterase [Desulfobacteraceae bacterium]|nr:MAG: acyl-CoA thioesterase [Desulfobacteraceae bacterium]